MCLAPARRPRGTIAELLRRASDTGVNRRRSLLLRRPNFYLKRWSIPYELEPFPVTAHCIDAADIERALMGDAWASEFIERYGKADRERWRELIAKRKSKRKKAKRRCANST